MSASKGLLAGSRAGTSVSKLDGWLDTGVVGGLSAVPVSAKPVGQEVLVVPLVAVVVLAAQLTLKLVPGQEVLVVPEVAVVVLEAVRARLVATVTGSAGFSVFVVSSVLAFLEGCVAPTPHVLMPGWAPQVVRYS